MRIIAVTTNLFNPSCTFLICWIYLFFFFLFSSWLIFVLGLFIIVVQFEYTLHSTHLCLFTININTCWFHSNKFYIHLYLVYRVYTMLCSSMFFFFFVIQQLFLESLDRLLRLLFSLITSVFFYYYYSVGFKKRAKWTNTN